MRIPSTGTAQRTAPPEVDRLHEINAAALAHWADRMGRAAAWRYLSSRRIDMTALADTYTVGYARSGWTTTTDHLRADGFTETDLIDAGLSTVSRHGELVDRFHSRIMFPIRTPDGDIAGFIGRRVSADEQVPKYLNTPATAAFSKGTVLYGLHENLALGYHQPIIVEGPTDVLAIASAAARNGQNVAAMAACGVAFTSDHADAVAHFCKSRGVQPVIAYDGDAPGRDAAIVAGELLRAVDLRPYLAKLPDGADPASALASGANLAPFLPPPNGAAIPLPAAVANRIIDEYHAQWRPEWPETKVQIARAITRYLTAYPAEALPEAAGQALTVAATRAGVGTEVLLTTAQDLTVPHTPARQLPLRTLTI